MKINEVEQILGITKANIRFYEKEGLLTPGRTESGYRDYTDSDIERLKTIVIYRKLGIPVQQIADILDGAISLQEALDTNIQVLNTEIEKLNGSLALCKQLKAEDADALDTERYWDLIQNQESMGYRFRSLAEDYVNFVAPTLSWLYWIPEDAWSKPLRVGKYLLGYSLAFAVIYSFIGENLVERFGFEFWGRIGGILIWALLLLPVYLIGKKHPKFANWFTTFLMVATPIAAFLFLAVAMLMAFDT